MTPKNPVDPEGDDSLGVLDDTPSSDTTGIGLHGGTAQVNVAMPTSADDDDLIDDEIVDGELEPAAIVSDLILDTSAVADPDTIARIEQEAPAIVIELPAEQFDPQPQGEHDETDTGSVEAIAQDEDATHDDERGHDEAAFDEAPAETAEIVIETEDIAPEDDAPEDDTAPNVEHESEDLESEDFEPEGLEVEDRETEDVEIDELEDQDLETEDVEAETLAPEALAPETLAPEVVEPEAVEPDDVAPEAVAPEDFAPEDVAPEDFAPEDFDADALAPEDLEAEDVTTADRESEGVDAAEESTVTEPAVAEPAAAEPDAVASDIVEPAAVASDETDTDVETAPDGADAGPADAAPQEAVQKASASDSASTDLDADRLAHFESVVAAAKAQLRDAMAPTISDEAPEKQSDARPKPAEPEQEISPVSNDDRAPVARSAADSPRPHAESPRANAEVALTSKRLDDLGASQRESADLLTADRLLEPSRVAKPEPEGTWSHLLYAISGGRINVGDSRKARERKELNARIAAPMTGAARFVPVLSRKGGVGKTTVTALLGMALADARDDRVIAVDANPDRGTLAERVVGAHSKSVRDMVRAQHDIRGFHDISALVARDETRLDVLASDADPRVSEAFGDADYREVATIAAQYYSLVLTDSGTGIVHSVMGATLDLADQIVIVSGLSVDEARLASETLTWLETNGYAELAREAIVVLNQSTPGAPMVRLGELESHFSTRAKHVLRVPYDPQIAGGGAIDFASLQPATRQAARKIAAILVEGLRARAA